VLQIVVALIFFALMERKEKTKFSHVRLSQSKRTWKEQTL